MSRKKTIAIDEIDGSRRVEREILRGIYIAGLESRGEWPAALAWVSFTEQTAPVRFRSAPRLPRPRSFLSL